MAVSPPEVLVQADEVEEDVTVDGWNDIESVVHEQLRSEDVQPQETVTATISEAVGVLSCPSKEEELPVEEAAAVSLELAGPREVAEAEMETPVHGELPVSEEVFQVESTSDVAALEELRAVVAEISVDLVCEVTTAPQVQTLEAARVEETVSLEEALTATTDAAAEMMITAPAVEKEERLDLETSKEDVDVVDRMAELSVVGDVGPSVVPDAADKTEVKIDNAEEQTLRQATGAEEDIPEEGLEPLETEPTKDELCPTEVVYDDVLPKDVVTEATVKMEDVAADLTVGRQRELVEAETSLSLPQEDEKLELLQALSAEESWPEDVAESLVTEPPTDELRPTDVVCDEVLPKERIAVETVKSEESAAAAAAAEITVQAPVVAEEAEAEGSVSLPKEVEATQLSEASTADETHPEEFSEALATEFPTEKLHPAEVVYDNIMSKENVAVETVTTEECAGAELSVKVPVLPEELEAESSISLPKEEKEFQLLWASSVEETFPEESVEPLATELTADELHPVEVVYKDILSKENIAVTKTMKIEECAAAEELAVKLPVSPDEADAEESVTLPKEVEKIQLSEASPVDESNPEEVAEPLVTEIPTDKLRATEVVYKDILSKESVVVESVKTEESAAAEISAQPPVLAEEAAAESSISMPEAKEESATIELETATPTIAESSTISLPPGYVEESVVMPSLGIEKAARTEEAEGPRSDVEAEASLFLAKPPTPEVARTEESLRISKPEEDESVSLETRKPEPEIVEDSATLSTLEPAADDDQSASLSLRRQQLPEEAGAELALSLTRPEDGMTPRRAAHTTGNRFAVKRCFVDRFV